MNRQKNDLINFVVLTLLGLAVLLTISLPQLAQEQRQTVQTLELSVVVREPDSGIWSNTRLGMEQAANDLGAELRFLTLTPANDGGAQEALLRREAEGGANALIAVPADSAALSSDLTALTGRTPLITLESPVDGAAGFVSPDNAALGRALAQAVLDDWWGGGVLLLDTAGECAGVSERLESARQLLLEQNVPLRIWLAPPEYTAAELSAAAKESGAAYVMAFEASATEYLSSVQESGPLSLHLYGVGSTANIIASLDRGTLTAAAVWSEYTTGYLAVQGAVLAAQGKSPDSAPLAFWILRGEDIYALENQKLLFPITS